MKMGNLYSNDDSEKIFKISGTIEYKNGNIYTGQVIDNKPNGKGVLKYPNGMQITGIFKSSKIIKNPKLTHKNIIVKILPNLNNEITFTDKTDIIISKENIWKKLTGKNFSKFEDLFIYGSLHKGEKTYTGNIINGKVTGKNCTIVGDGYNYKGSVVDSKMCGNGKLNFCCGKTIIGEFINDDIKSGKIIYLNAIYEGAIRYFKPFGNGKINCGDNIIINGTFYGGFLIKDAYIIAKNYKIYVLENIRYDRFLETKIYKVKIQHDSGIVLFTNLNIQQIFDFCKNKKFGSYIEGEMFISEYKFKHRFLSTIKYDPNYKTNIYKNDSLIFSGKFVNLVQMNGKLLTNKYIAQGLFKRMKPHGNCIVSRMFKGIKKGKNKESTIELPSKVPQYHGIFENGIFKKGKIMFGPYSDTVHRLSFFELLTAQTMEFEGIATASHPYENYDFIKGKLVIYAPNVFDNIVDKIIYTGKFKKNKIANGTMETSEFVYKGEFKDGKMHGQGEIKYKQSGDIYKGEFYDGKRYGVGVSIKIEKGLHSKSFNCQNNDFAETYDVEIRKKTYCAICLSEKPTHLFNNCGHKCVCEECVTNNYKLETEYNCPLCNKKGKLIKLWD